MNWITNYVRPKISSLLQRKDMPENLWVKCPETGQMVFYRDVEANLFVIPDSGHEGMDRRVKALLIAADQIDLDLRRLVPDNRNGVIVHHDSALGADDLQTIAVQIGGERVPLEVDYTTPLAVMARMSEPPSGIDALLNTDEYDSKSGLIMFQPYRPDRIPVLFVHGLASGPDTWLPLYNRLLDDETIRTGLAPTARAPIT